MNRIRLYEPNKKRNIYIFIHIYEYINKKMETEITKKKIDYR